MICLNHHFFFVQYLKAQYDWARFQLISLGAIAIWELQAMCRVKM
jgi:hypothetical protein